MSQRQPPVPDDGLLDRAIALQQEGQFDQAAAIYQQLLLAQPNHPDALHLLGLTRHFTGQNPQAIELILKAIAVAPDQPVFLNSLGLIQLKQGHLDQAVVSLRRAIELDDQFAQAHHNLGVALFQLGQFQDAHQCQQQAVALNPDYLNAHVHLGHLHRLNKNLQEAAQCYQQALQRDPNHLDALIGLGAVLHEAKRFDQALELLDHATQIAPDSVAVHCELADTLQSAGRLELAVAAYQQAAALDDRSLRAWYGLGCAQIKQHEYALAVTTFEIALKIQHDHVGSIHNLGKALFKLGHTDEAFDQFEKAHALDPAGPSQQAIAVGIPGSPRATHQSILDARRQWALHHALPPEQVRSWSPPSPESLLGSPRRLRIGYVSSFFQKRNWMKPVWALINRHDRTRFEVHLFCDAPEPSLQHGYDSEQIDQFHDISPLSNQQVADLIVRSQIDILIDLNGYSSTHRLPLFMHKPAPIIIGWFNMYATTAMDCFDYLIGDPLVIPPHEEKHYTEQIERVTGCYLTFEVTYPVPEVVPPPITKNGSLTFGCLASQYKITPHVIHAWSRILQQSPTTKLIIKNAALKSASNRQFLHDQFARHGIDPTRVELQGPSEHFQFLETYNQIDIALDTFPYNGGTTTTEALWQGVPVITFTGDRWVARTSATLLHHAGLNEFIATDMDDYIQKAVDWSQRQPHANTVDRLSLLRKEMRTSLQPTPVCAAQVLARDVEQIYETVWERRGDQQA